MALYLRLKDRLGANTQAFLYKWTHIPTQKWYVGSRTAVGCHIDEGSNGWIFQSKETI